MQRKKIKNFIDDSVVFDLDRDVIFQCVLLRRKRKIKTPDAIIAATALCNNFVLVTNNTRDFNHIKALKVIDPNGL
jgi:predicted nucleic acid-binding protein